MNAIGINRRGRPRRRWSDEVTLNGATVIAAHTEQTSKYMASCVQSAIDSHVRTQAREADDDGGFYNSGKCDTDKVAGVENAGVSPVDSQPKNKLRQR